MKRLLLKGGLLCLLSFATCLAWAQDTDADNLTATWDWQNDSPTGIREVTDFQSTSTQTGTVASTIDGIYMYVDATTSGAKLTGRTVYKTTTDDEGNTVDTEEVNYCDAQFNSGTKIQVPVGSTSDVVTVVGRSNNNYSVGGTAATDYTTTYNPSSTDVGNGYVEIVATSGSYLNSVSVTYTSEDEINSLKDTSVTVTWDWVNTIRDTNINGSTGYVTGSVGIDDYSGDDVKIYVDASNGKLDSQNRTSDAQFNSGTIIHIPVVSTNDLVTINNYDANYAVDGTSATAATTEYSPCDSDIVNGFVVLEATAATYLNSINVVFANEDELSNIMEDIVTFKNVSEENGNGNEGDGSETTGVTKEVALYTTDFTEWSEIDRK
ncbi:MAG: hypothetical protein LUC88_08420, partial [Prevotella sp.]|nr:hypothetical protein [Prevotella sp.]